MSGVLSRLDTSPGNLVLMVLMLMAMARIAWVDARRFRIDMWALAALAVLGVFWHGTPAWERVTWLMPWSAGIGGLFGLILGWGSIVAAELLGWRRPIMAGDAWLVLCLGFVLGVKGLAMAFLVGGVSMAVRHLWVQYRRGRPLWGPGPLAPGMMVGAAVAFLALNLGVPASAAEKAGGGGKVVAPVVTSGPLAPLAATEIAPRAVPLPEDIARREVEFATEEPLALMQVLDRIATITGVPIELEERPSRVGGGFRALEDPPAISLRYKGELGGLLDLVARESGYAWDWRDAAIVFHRYWDVEQQAPRPVNDAEPGELWIADADTHRTLRGVLEDWSGRTDWMLVWKSSRDYALGARAEFRGGFLEAVDLLLSGESTRRRLLVRAYTANRQLVIEDAGGLR